jgi:hypothetical protein
MLKWYARRSRPTVHMYGLLCKAIQGRFSHMFAGAPGQKRTYVFTCLRMRNDSSSAEQISDVGSAWAVGGRISVN